MEEEKKIQGAADIPSPEEAPTAEETPTPKELTIEEKLAEAEARVAELEKERLYRQAEFDNYRKNAIKEKTELILSGGRRALEAMLPVMDDLELALTSINMHASLDALKEGVSLIQKKFTQALRSQGVEAIDCEGKDFDTDFHEAIAQLPAPSEAKKGKVLECVKKGYTLNGRVLRFAQVVVGV